MVTTASTGTTKRTSSRQRALPKIGKLTVEL